MEFKNIISINGTEFKIRLIENEKEWNEMMNVVDNSDDIIHYKNCYSWCIDKHDESRMFRGYNSDRYWGYSSPSNHSPYVGFRPVLEPMSSNEFNTIHNGLSVYFGSIYINDVVIDPTQTIIFDYPCKIKIGDYAGKFLPIHWIYFNGKFVANRNLISNISFNDLNNIFCFE